MAAISVTIKSRSCAPAVFAACGRSILTASELTLTKPGGGFRGYIAAGVLAVLATAALSPVLLRDPYMPHWYCFLGDRGLLATHLVTDIIIGLSYTAIAVTLALLVHRSYGRLRFHWLVLAFGTFSIACGATHYLEAVTLFKPVYWLSGYVKILTALASLGTAIALPLVSPQILAAIDAASLSEERRRQLETANRELARATMDLQELDRLKTTFVAQRAANIGSWELLPESGRMHWSEPVEIMHGLAPGTFGGTLADALATVHPEDRERVRRHLAESLIGGGLQVDYRVVQPDGRVSWVAARGKFVLDAGGRPPRILGVSIDIDARKRTELELQKQTRVLDLASDAILVLDPESRITFWNRGAEQLYGWPRQEALGENAHQLLRTEFPTSPAEIRAALAEHGEWHGELVHTTRAGRKVTVASRWTPQVDESGALIGTFEINRDITAQKSAEEALRRSEKLAATGRLAATIAHEINNPLEAVTNLIYLARTDESLSSNTREFLAMADQELLRVSQLAKQTLGFYHDHQIADAVEAGPMLESVLALYAGRVRAKSLRVEHRYASGAEQELVPSETRQVIANLVANAIDASSPGGRLVVGLRCLSARPAGVLISVADTGSGIPRELWTAIFEPFYTTKKDVGTGLGLWVSDEIVRKYGGRIRVRSSTRPGASGTVFGVFLPTMAEPAAGAMAG
jgi:PAS domain S-box-containing protein